MNLKSIFNLIGNLLLILGLAMFFPIIVGLFYGERDIFIFLFSLIVTIITGVLFKSFQADERRFTYKDGYITVIMGWLIASIFGAIPFLLSGVFYTPLDAFFESVSGFTTTGATVISSIESLSYSLLFWRSFIHWLGGMGIIGMVMIFIPELAGNIFIYKRETTGPFNSRIKPRIREAARFLWYIYLILTILEIILLKNYGMSFFDSLIHSFGTISTGGFSSTVLSIKKYDSLSLEIIVIVFMYLSGINFGIYYYGLKKGIKTILNNDELKLYTLIILSATALITFNINFNLYSDLFLSFRHALFQVISIITTTGFATVNYDIWPPFSRWMLLVLMLIGGCAGSTAGGIKVIRIIILYKAVKQELRRLIYPEIVEKIKINQRIVSDKIVKNILGFFFLYIAVMIIVIFFLTSTGLDLISSLSATASALGNVGPGLKLVGPLNSFAVLTPFSRLLLIICMLLGRLELYTVFVFIFIEWR